MRTLALLLLLLSQPALSQAQVLVPGTSVELAPPPGFELAEAFAGLVHPGTGSSVQVAQFRGTPLDEIRTALAPDSLLLRGYDTATLSDIHVRGAPALWAKGVQRQDGRAFSKRSLAVETSDGVVLLSASVPTDAPEVLSTVEALLRDFQPPGAPAPDLFAGLPFSATLPWETPDVQRVSETVLAQTDSSASNRARFAIGVEQPPAALAGMPLADLARERHRASLGDDLVSTDLQFRELTVDGRRAVEVASDGSNAVTGSMRLIYLVLIPASEPGTFVVVQGLGGGDAPRDWLEVFRRATASVRWSG